MEKKDWVQHIGDDKLVYGMPKHMVGVSTKESLARWQQAQNDRGGSKQPKQPDTEARFYWTVHPKANACEKCKTLAGKSFCRNRSALIPIANAKSKSIRCEDLPDILMGP